MAVFGIKLHRYNPGVFDQWGFELQYPEVEGTEDNLATLPKNNILAIQIKYLTTNTDPSKQYGRNLQGCNFYYLNLIGAGILEVAQFNSNSRNYNIPGVMNSAGEFAQEVRAQVGGESSKSLRVQSGTWDTNRVFTGVLVSDTLYDEMLRRMGGIYPPPPGSD